MPQIPSYFIVTEVISEDTYARVLQLAREATFLDGATTAGRWEGHRKRNMQADRAEIHAVCNAVMDEVMTNRTLCNRALPHEAVQPVLNRYRAGDFYGLHEDSPIQSGIRADLSYTLFLSDPQAYEGGELRLGSGEAEVALKLPPRALVCYSSGTLHQVSPVASGERLALVGWMQSVVRDPGQRTMLAELHETIDALTSRAGVGEQISALSRLYGGLMRQWAFG